MTGAPYIGLRAFEGKDAHLFFGRDRLVANLIARLRAARRFIAVLGLSGEGKSSLVRAGLIPALKAGYLDWNGSSWDVTTMRPDINPLEGLAKAVADSAWGKNYGRGWKNILDELREDSSSLARLFIENPAPSKARLLIVVDQFEELFTRAHKRDADTSIDAEMFVDALMDATTRSDQIYVLVTMRSEYLGECAEYSNLAEAITRGVFLVTRMRPNELAEAIEMPANLAGGGIEPELTYLLLERLRGKTQLPILQHALMRMWQDAQKTPDESGKITRRHYDRLGTESASLDVHLDEVYTALEPHLKPVAEVVFRRITKQTSRNEQTGEFQYVRDSATVAEIAKVAVPDPSLEPEELERFKKLTEHLTQENIIKVVEAFRAPGLTFLQPLKDHAPNLGPHDVIDVTHEAVINNWKRAKAWASTEGENARLFQELCERAARERTAGLLLEKSEFDRVNNWFNGSTLWLRGPSLSAKWAERYKGKREELDFDRAKSFLKRSQDQLGQRELRDAIKDGQVSAADRIIRRGVRLSDDFQRWEFSPHYFALIPSEIPKQRGVRDASQRQAAAMSGAQQESIQTTELKLTQEELDWAFPSQDQREMRSPAFGITLQHLAAHGGNEQVLTHLIEKLKLPFDVVSDRKWTPLHRAAINGKLAAVKLLHAHIGDSQKTIHARDIDGDDALNLAIEGAHGNADAERLELITWLLDQGADINVANNRQGWRPLHWAAQWGGKEVVSLLASRSPDLNIRDKEGRTALRLAAEFGRPETLRTLIAAGANINADDNLGRTPLLVAAAKNDDLIVKILLEHGAEVNEADVEGVTPLLACLRSQARDPIYGVLDLLLRNGANANDVYNPTGETALHIAVRRPDGGWAENSFIVRLLLQNDALVDVEDDEKLTPVAIALQKGNVRMAMDFVRRGKRENDEFDKRWLIAAARAGARDLVKTLTDAGQRADAKDDLGVTALHAAAEADEAGVLEMLAAQPGVNLNVENAAGLTPMRVALIEDNLRAAHVLARRGVALPRGLRLEMSGEHLEVELEDWDKIRPQLEAQLQQSAAAEWPIAPIMKGAWKGLAAKEAAAALEPLFEDEDFVARVVPERIDAVREAPLCFLDGGKIFEARMSKDGGVLGYLTFLVHEGGFALVDGFTPSDKIELYGAFRIESEADASEYLRFYCGALSFDQGLLTPIEQAGDGLLNVSASAEHRATVDSQAAAIKWAPQSEAASGWRGEFVAQYGPELWRIGATIHADGACTLQGEPFAGGLPFVRSAFINGVRTVRPG